MMFRRRKALPSKGRGEWWEASCAPKDCGQVIGNLYLATGYNTKRGLLRVDVISADAGAALAALRKVLGV